MLSTTNITYVYVFNPACFINNGFETQKWSRV